MSARSASIFRRCVRHSKTYAVECNVADRLSFAGGDFFKHPLPSADVIVLGRVLHNWNLETKKMLLAKAYQAVPTGGAVIVYDYADRQRKADQQRWATILS